MSENFEYKNYLLVIELHDYYYSGKCEELEFDDTSSDKDYLKKDFKKLVDKTLKEKEKIQYGQEMLAQDCVNARLIRFEHGSISDLPSNSPTPYFYYFALVFLKGGREIKMVYDGKVGNSFDSSYLQYINKVVEKIEEEGIQHKYCFTDGTWISMS